MPTRRHYRRPNPDRRRALELLAGTVTVMRGTGRSLPMP